MYVCTYVRMYVCMYVCMYIHTCIHTYIHTYIHTCMYVCMYVRTYVRAFACPIAKVHQVAYLELVYLVTAFVPSDTACLASSYVREYMPTYIQCMHTCT